MVKGGHANLFLKSENYKSAILGLILQ